MIDSISDSAGAAADLKKARRQKSARADARPAIDRLPPHSPEAEMGVLGCALLSPNECMGECFEKLKGDGHEVFYDLRHQTIYETLAVMYDTREAIDVITLQQKLKDKQLLEQVGGIAYLAQLQDSVPSAANLSYYLEIIQEKYLLRRMISTCTDVVGRVYDYEGDVETLLDDVEKEILFCPDGGSWCVLIARLTCSDRSLQRRTASRNNDSVLGIPLRGNFGN